MNDAGENIGTVLAATRRYVFLTPDRKTIIQGTVASRAVEAVVGDRVTFSLRDGHAFLETVRERRSAIARSYRGETRLIASNLDHLFIVAAVQPLFNTLFIDRLSAVAASQDIPFSLLVNKVDLGVESTARLIDVYARCGFKVLLTSAKYGEGLEELLSELGRPELQTVALAGVSGVGKSTFLNQLIPGVEQRTNEVSEKTGQGRQTTSQALGFLFPRENAVPLIIIDLPGIQNFGVSHLSPEQVADSFPEIVELRSGCRYSNCGHVNEQECAVKEAVKTSRFAGCRYDSYVHMLEEVNAAREY